MSNGEKVYARLPFGYNKQFRDRGEVFALIGGRNDEKLRGARYFLPFISKEHKEILCDKCGRKFIAESFFEQHKRKKFCNDDSAVPTRIETAELIGADPEKFIMEKDDVNQKATNFSGAVGE
jgi:hypothetical protein